MLQLLRNRICTYVTTIPEILYRIVCVSVFAQKFQTYECSYHEIIARVDIGQGISLGPALFIIGASAVREGPQCVATTTDRGQSS